jgi:hypothetical protein
MNMAADHDSLIEAERALQSAQLANDANALECLLHDHLRFVGPDGAAHDKAADLAACESGLVSYKSSNPIEIEVHVYGTTGLSLVLVELEVLANGESVIGEYRYTRTWLYEDDRWQIVAGAAVPAKPS